MGAAPMAFVLWDRFMRFNPKNPKWFNRDRFVLSAGHGCMLQYALLYFTGYDSVTLDDIKQFRQWESRTPGHPENFMTQGVEVTTGPLGQGIANAVGLAMAELTSLLSLTSPTTPLLTTTPMSLWATAATWKVFLAKLVLWPDTSDSAN